MSRSAAQREAAVSRKRRQRDRERQAARLAAAAQAARQEAAEEKLAPAVMRQTITSTEGYMLTGPRVRIINGRPERCDPIANARYHEFTFLRKWAARQFQLDWNDVGCGENVAAVDYLRSGGGSGAADGWPGGHHAMMEQVKARGRLQGALAALGAFAPGVCRVVLDGVPISAWVLEGDPCSTVDEGVKWIALALDRLVLFYDPPAPAKRVVIRTIGPARTDYTTEVESNE
jgi:hypothetical protein